VLARYLGKVKSGFLASKTPLGMTNLAGSENLANSENPATLRGGLGCAYEGFDHGAEDYQAVFGVQGGFYGALGMGHEAGDVAFAIADASDVVCGTVGIAGVVVFAVGRGVAEQDLVIFFESGEHGFIAIVIAVAVGDGEFEDLAFLRGVGEGGVGVFYADMHVAADEAEAGVAHHGAGEEASFEEDLETVADAEDEAAGLGEFGDGVHDGRKAGDGAGAEIVAVGEAAGEDDGVAIVEVFGLVPDEFDGLFEDVTDGVEGVVIAVGPGKDYDSEFHGTSGSAAGIFILAQREKN
jgi:hypothetical protein